MIPAALAQAAPAPRPPPTQAAVAAPKVATSPTEHVNPAPTAGPAQPSQLPRLRSSASAYLFQLIDPPPHGVLILTPPDITTAIIATTTKIFFILSVCYFKILII